MSAIRSPERHPTRKSACVVRNHGLALLSQRFRLCRIISQGDYFAVTTLTNPDCKIS